MANEKLNINYKTQNKTQATPQIKKTPPKKPRIGVGQTTDMTLKTSRHVLKIHASLTPSVEKTVNLHRFKQADKSRNIIVLFRQCKS